MNNYTVNVTRIGYGHRLMDIEANSIEDAKRKALETAGNFEFSEKSSEYLVEDCVLNRHSVRCIACDKIFDEREGTTAPDGMGTLCSTCINTALYTYTFAEKNGNGVIVLTETGDENKAYEALEEKVRYPQEWRLDHVIGEVDEDEEYE